MGTRVGTRHFLLQSYFHLPLVSYPSGIQTLVISTTCDPHHILTGHWFHTLLAYRHYQYCRLRSVPPSISACQASIRGRPGFNSPPENPLFFFSSTPYTEYWHENCPLGSRWVHAGLSSRYTYRPQASRPEYCILRYSGSRQGSGSAA